MVPAQGVRLTDPSVNRYAIVMGETVEAVDADDVDELSLLTQPGREDDLQTFLLLLHPADVAELLAEAKESTALVILSRVSPERAAELVSELEPADQERILRMVRPEQLGPILEQMDTDDAVDLLQELDEGTASQVLAQMPAEERREVSQLLAYDPASAGGLMQTELVKVPLAATVGSAIDLARPDAAEFQIFSLFVVDDVGRYAGQVALQDLLFARPETPIEQLMKPKPVEVRTDVDQEEVARLFDRYSLVELGVVDHDGLLVGRITADDVHEVLVEEHGEDLLKMAGTWGEPEELYADSPWTVVGRRLPWLGATLLGGLAASLILVEGVLGMPEAGVLLAFVPLVISLASNVGAQSATIMIRGLALGRIDPAAIGAHLLKDLRVGAIMGTMVGALVAALLTVWRGRPTLGLAVGGALALAMATASVLGTVEPLLLRKLGVDPALASGPLITSLNDIGGVLIYTLLALALYGLP